MKNTIIATICAALLIGWGGCSRTNQALTAVDLRTEYLREPIGIGTPYPRFTWSYQSDADSLSTVSRAEVWLGADPEHLRRYDASTPLEPHTKYYWRVKVWDAKDRPCHASGLATFETGKLKPTDWTGKWITDRHDKEYEPAPLFRKRVALEKDIRSARLCIAAAGYYEAFLNGRRVGANFLDPGYTHFDKRILSVTHDVTDLLTEGDNLLAVVLGNGWYNVQTKAVWNFETARWRNRPRMLCELRVTYADGSTDTIATDESWLTSTGPYLYNAIYSGDIYDARLDGGWKTPAFDDSGWQHALATDAPAPLIAAQQMPAISCVGRLKPVSVKKFSDRLYVYSFAENIAGLCELRVKGKAGTKISLRHGELLKPDGRLEPGNINVYYHPQKPYETFQQDVYYLAGTGAEEAYTPSFSYHGFQYVEVESSEPVELTESSLCVNVLNTAVEKAGDFACSNEMLNRLWQATMRSYLGNLHSIPTDCPQREKNGWTADAHVAIDLALLGYDGITVYEKWMNDFIDNQREAGDISGIIPSSGWGYGEWPGPVWDAAMFIIPNALYNYYGDTQCIKTLYPAMERYLKYLQTKEKDGYLTFGLGDWVYWKATTNNEYTSTAYYYLDNQLMARFARLLGKDAAPYEQKAAGLKRLINEKFFNESTAVYAEGTQTAQALALYLGIVPEGKEQAVADRLHETVAANGYFLDFGLLGSKTVPAMLAKYGHIQDAMNMLLQTEAPSWGYWIHTMGYTTLPETWTLSPQFHDASLNHVFMGDVAAWMMNQLAGINYDGDHPGFRNVRITPHFVKELEWVKGSYRSRSGLITSSWQRDGDKVALHVEIPANCTADILVNGETKHVGAGRHSFVY